MSDALRRYKGKDGTETYSAFIQAETRAGDHGVHPDFDVPPAKVSTALAAEIQATVGDRIYVRDRRAWLGGLKSRHCIVIEIVNQGGRWVEVADDVIDEVGHDVRVQRMY